VIAAAMIGRRRVNTLVLVHRTELLKQWQERLGIFLNAGKDVIGTVGGGRARPTGRIDIAVMQTVSRKGQIDDIVERYGQVIVDECHHLSAVSFEQILKRVRARYVLGLTATPIRRDGHQPIIFMQCGPIRHTAARPDTQPRALTVIARYLSAVLPLVPEAPIQEVFRTLVADANRNATIAADVRQAWLEGRKVLVLTERTDHLDALRGAMGDGIEHLFTLHGRMARKERDAMTGMLARLPDDVPRVLLATGRLVGEGFDHPPLDTLVLAMPISWKGTLQQYTGRLHREHVSKIDIRIYDYADTGHPALMRMWAKRQRGYRAMSYRITDDNLKLA